MMDGETIGLTIYNKYTFAIWRRYIRESVCGEENSEHGPSACLVNNGRGVKGGFGDIGRVLVFGLTTNKLAIWRRYTKASQWAASKRVFSQ